MLKNVLVVAALAVSGLVSAQDFNIGGVYSGSTSSVDASYGVELGYKSFGIMIQNGAYLNQIDMQSSVEALMNGASVITGGTYTRYNAFVQGYFSEKKTLSFRVGAGLEQKDLIGARSEYVFTKAESDYTVLFGLGFNIPETNLYISASAISSLGIDSNITGAFGFGFRL